MKITITSRRTEVDPEVSERAEARVSKLSRFEPRLTAAELVFSLQGHTKQAEAILSIEKSEPVVATGQAAEFREAVDVLVEKLEKILRRRRSQKRDHRAPGIKNLPQTDGT